MAPDINKGAYIIRLMADGDSYRANDGASPVYSQGGYGLFPAPRAIDMGDVDHQQFYEDASDAVVRKSYAIMNEISKCDCATIEEYKSENNSISAKLKLSMDPKPGDRIKQIKLMAENKETNEITTPAAQVNIQSNGNFTLQLDNDKVDIEKENIRLVIVFKDESELSYQGNPALQGTWHIVPEKGTMAYDGCENDQPDQLYPEEDINFIQTYVIYSRYSMQTEGNEIVLKDEYYKKESVQPERGSEWRIQFTGPTAIKGTYTSWYICGRNGHDDRMNYKVTNTHKFTGKRISLDPIIPLIKSTN